MKAQDERRSPDAVEDEPLPAELIALLKMCGAEMRAADRDSASAANGPESLEHRGPERRHHGAG